MRSRSRRLIDEIARQIKADITLPKRPLDLYEFDRGIYLIDVPLNQTVNGFVNGKRNILTFNFWALKFGLLGDFNAGGAVDVGGGVYTLRTIGDPQWGAVQLAIGSDSTPEDITQYKLGNEIATLPTTVTFGRLSDRNRITLSGVTTQDASEVGIKAPLRNDAGWNLWFLIARKAMTVSANQAINWYIDFLQPWLYNWALAMYGYLTDSNPSGVVDELGYIYQVRTWADANAGSVRIRVSSQTYTWSPDLATISAELEIPPYLRYDNFRNIVYLFIIGNVIPPDDMSVNTVALMQPMFDTNGNVRNTYVAVIPLSSPATLYKNRSNLIFIRLVAM